MREEGGGAGPSQEVTDLCSAGPGANAGHHQAGLFGRQKYRMDGRTIGQEDPEPHPRLERGLHKSGGQFP